MEASNRHHNNLGSLCDAVCGVVNNLDVAEFADLLVNISDLLAKLTNVTQYNHLRLLNFGVHAQHATNRKGTGLTGSVLGLGNHAAVFAALLLGDDGDGEALNVGGH